MYVHACIHVLFLLLCFETEGVYHYIHLYVIHIMSCFVVRKRMYITEWYLYVYIGIFLCFVCICTCMLSSCMVYISRCSPILHGYFVIQNRIHVVIITSVKKGIHPSRITHTLIELHINCTRSSFALFTNYHASYRYNN